MNIEHCLRGLIAGAVMAALGLAAAPAWADLPPRSALGHSDKLRVLVDKVVMRANDWHMTEDNVREIAAAGFNIVCPRIGGEDPERVRRVGQLAGKHGIYYMAWMRGTLSAPADAPEEAKLVWANGVVQNLYSPNADELWEWMTAIVLGQARVSAEVPAVLGAFFDFENYAANKQGNCYELSYDLRIMREFARAQGIALPELEPARRAEWLRERRLHDEFERFQLASWRARCRQLRQQVDAINPAFQFIVYPAPGTLFIREAVYPEWATSAAPLILADAATYGRRSRDFLPEQEVLEVNRRILVENMQSARARGAPMLYMGGIDPIVWGADPEFSGKNAVMISHASDGYWIFYEGPTYGQEDHAQYWWWFTWANRAIAAGDWAARQAPRRTPDPYHVDLGPGFDLERALAAVRSLAVPERIAGRLELTVWQRYPYSRQFREENDYFFLPTRWRFRSAPDRTHGITRGWHQVAIDESAWETVSIESQWYTQGRPDLTGWAWGRVSFKAPEAFRGRQVFLRFGGVDEQGWIYLNGRYLYRHPREEMTDAWMSPFEVEVTDAIWPGVVNTLAVACYAATTLGGVWQPVVLYAPKRGAR